MKYHFDSYPGCAHLKEGILFVNNASSHFIAKAFVNSVLTIDRFLIFNVFLNLIRR